LNCPGSKIDEINARVGDVDKEYVRSHRMMYDSCNMSEEREKRPLLLGVGGGVDWPI
jgi:hypothetical protein